jgi:hypothetical protein
VLIREGLKAEYFNDDVLGRTLDKVMSDSLPVFISAQFNSIPSSYNSAYTAHFVRPNSTFLFFSLKISTGVFPSSFACSSTSLNRDQVAMRFLTKRKPVLKEKQK